MLNNGSFFEKGKCLSADETDKQLFSDYDKKQEPRAPFLSIKFHDFVKRFKRPQTRLFRRPAKGHLRDQHPAFRNIPFLCGIRIHKRIIVLEGRCDLPLRKRKPYRIFQNRVIVSARKRPAALQDAAPFPQYPKISRAPHS